MNNEQNLKNKGDHNTIIQENNVYTHYTSILGISASNSDFRRRTQVGNTA